MSERPAGRLQAIVHFFSISRRQPGCRRRKVAAPMRARNINGRSAVVVSGWRNLTASSDYLHLRSTPHPLVGI